ncbi:aggregation-promoting factor C-terminal-like domain-containing protein [Actinocorallia populi]|uniref:aggregation-promoting factor C-terminal-like domain-containing protein n=1 Tax=Actinocorallia populi TaxID=2079200 RepID=UPI001E4D4CA4|nr:hypothetical protein [Actinocorallia populi]
MSGARDVPRSTSAPETRVRAGLSQTGRPATRAASRRAGDVDGAGTARGTAGAAIDEGNILIGTRPLWISRRLPVAATAVVAATGLWSAPAAAETNVSLPSEGAAARQALRINPQVHRVHRVPGAQVIQKVQKAQALKKAARASLEQKAVQASRRQKKAARKQQQQKRSLSRADRNKLVGLELAARFGWEEKRQWRCLERLWTRESGWNHLARNPSSGAHGIPQALPGSKMGGVGADWRTNPETQIKWGLRYIKGRYGTPCAAWAHFGASGWY